MPAAYSASTCAGREIDLRWIYTARVRSVLVSLALAAVCGLFAQQAQSPAFRAVKTLALVDVTVTDKAGSPVTDLDPADFDLTSAGRHVPVEAFYRVVDNKMMPLTSRASASGAGAPYTPVRTFILFFDSQIGLAELGRAKTAAQAFLQRELGNGDYAEIGRASCRE